MEFVDIHIYDDSNYKIIQVEKNKLIENFGYFEILLSGRFKNEDIIIEVDNIEIFLSMIDIVNGKKINIFEDIDHPIEFFHILKRFLFKFTKDISNTLMYLISKKLYMCDDGFEIIEILEDLNVFDSTKLILELSKFEQCRNIKIIKFLNQKYPNQISSLVHLIQSSYNIFDIDRYDLNFLNELEKILIEDIINPNLDIIKNPENCVSFDFYNFKKVSKIINEIRRNVKLSHPFILIKNDDMCISTIKNMNKKFEIKYNDWILHDHELVFSSITSNWTYNTILIKIIE